MRKDWTCLIIWILVRVFIVPTPCYSQSLTIDQTIEYLNKVSIQNPDIAHDPNRGDASLDNLQWKCATIKIHYAFEIRKDGLITVDEFSSQYDCKDKNEDNRDTSFVYGKFFVEDIDLQNVDEYNKYAGSDHGFILQTTNNYNSISFPLRDAEDFKVSSINFYTSDHYNSTRFFNAMKYLIATAMEQGFRRDDKNDPFVNRPTDAKGTSEKSNTANAVYKIQLKEANGVFSLAASVKGVLVDFILDSGAGESNISSDTERELERTGAISRTDYLSNGLYRLADGSISECKRVKIPKITVGGKAFYNVIASIGPPGSPNLLGQSFLSKTNMWTIDNTKKCLVIH